MWIQGGKLLVEPTPPVSFADHWGPNICILTGSKTAGQSGWEVRENHGKKKNLHDLRSEILSWVNLKKENLKEKETDMSVLSLVIEGRKSKVGGGGRGGEFSAENI